MSLYYPDNVYASNAIPGWTALINGIPQPDILYNDATLGSSAVCIFSNGNSLIPVIAGNFSAMLIAGFGGDAALSQTGLVPADANSLLFADYSQGNGVADLSVTLNGQAINVMPIFTTAKYTLYGGNIAEFAGQTANLAFIAISDYPQGFEEITLDQISFSTNSVPEPGELALAALGASLLALRSRQTNAK
jgi:hypothetical protein